MISNLISPSAAKSLFFPNAFIFLLLWSGTAVCQISVLTQHYDNARTGQNNQETILTPANVNPVQFGKLFIQNLDGQEPGQPLYVPNVFIPALNSTHNVVYAATMHDSIYAFDADNNQGSNASPLWQVNFLDPDNGVTSVPQSDESCSVGYSEFGIQGTPVIDPNPNQNAIYVLAMTKENGSYVHRLHALDLGTGAELFGGPVTVAASVVINGETYTFVDKYQQQRPGLLLQNGIVYIGFGSPGCNIKTENGWVMAYDESTLQQVGAFDLSPGVEASAVWLSGGGLAGDGAGNIYFSTGDGLFDGPMGTHFGDSVVKLTQGDGVLNLADYFTPYNQYYFQQNDLDVSSGLVQLLPQQPDGRNFLMAIDKNGTAYLLDQNAMGGYSPAGDFQIPQELEVPVNGEVHAGLTYWNNTIYIAAYATPVMAYSFANDQLSLQPTSQTPKVTAHPQGGIVSSNMVNGNYVNAIYWDVTAPTGLLFAYDATNLATEFYDGGMDASRDRIPDSVHFPMPVVANGKVYVNAETQLAVFGLLPLLAPVGGNNQTGVTGTTLPVALQAGLQDSYGGNAVATAGIPVSFKASGKAGSFSNPNSVTNSTGTASTNYTLSSNAGTYTITASSPGYVAAVFTVTATSANAGVANAGIPATMSITAGNGQSSSVTSALPSPMSVKVKDTGGKTVAGVPISFSDGGAGGTLSPGTATTNSSGIATTTYRTGTTAGKQQITASASGISVVFKEIVLAGPPASLSIALGNNQSIKAGKSSGQVLEVLVEDQYANPVPGISVTFDDGGVGGSFSSDPAVSNSKGVAGTRYIAPAQTGPVTVTASSPGLSSVVFNVNVD